MSVHAICLNLDGILAGRCLSEISQVRGSQKGDISGAWKRICGRLSHIIPQDYDLALILKELCALEVVSSRVAILHVPTYFAARTIRKIPHGTLLRAIQSEFPPVEEIRIHRGTL